MTKTKTQISSFPLWLTLLLAALTVPRTVVHDLRLLSFDTIFYSALAIAPWIIWLFFALFWKTKKPLLDFVMIGLAYGLLLALTHQILWDASWGGNLPRLHGNLDPTVESLLLRTAAFISSVITGLVTGLTFGLIALLSSKVRSLSKSK